MRDYWDGDPEVAYAAIALVYSPRTPGHSVRGQGEAEGSKKNAIYA